MNAPQDPNRTVDEPSVPLDSLDAGLAAGFGRTQPPRSSLAPSHRPVLLKEAEGESNHVVKPNSDAMPPRAEVGDRYQLFGEIARGGMGAVLRGRDVDLGRDLAVKVLLEKHADRPEVAQRFIEEAQIGGQLQHPGVVPVYDIGRFGDRPFFTMKLVKGQTLAALLGERADPPADRPRFLAVALQVAQALAYAHAKGVIHRDLKPANVMVGAFGEVQVMDWGLAKVLAEGGVADEERASRAHQEPEDGTQIRTARSGSAGGHGTETEAGSLLGTPAYMPPEQANGDIVNLDRRADVFGLGAILCEVLTGKPPYVGRSGEEVRRKAANGDLVDAMARLDACGADAELIALTRRCLSPEASDRPKDAQEVTDGLTAYLNGVQERLQLAEQERAVAVVREAEQRQKRKVQLALAASVVGLLLGGGAFALWRAEQAQAGRERDARNGEAVASLLGQAEEALQANDTAKAAVVLEAAQKRSAEGGAEKDADRLKRLDAELALLRDLDAVDQLRWTWDENRFPDPAVVATRTREALQRFGADPDSVSVDEAAARVSASVVRERIVAALDRLLRTQKRAEVRAILRKVDGNPYRDAVRDAYLSDDLATRIADLAGQQAALEQPPGFAALLGESSAIPVQRRRQLLQAALHQQPGNLSVLMSLGNTYLGSDLRNKSEFRNERVRWYQAATAVAPGNFAAHINLGVVLHDNGRLDEAIACYRRAIDLNPKNALGHNNLGMAFRDQGQVEDAVVCIRKAIELNPKYTSAHYEMGRLHTSAEDYDAAIACYHRAIELDPKMANAHNNLGVALKAKGQVDEAITCYRKAIELDPKLAKVHANLGFALHKRGQEDEAITCYRKAIELDPKNVTAYGNLGRSLYIQNKVDEAITCWRKAIELDPKDVTAYLNLGVALKRKGQMDEAVSTCKKAIELDPKNAKTHYSYGDVLRAKGQVDEAISCFVKAIELDPNYAKAHCNLGIARMAKGQVDEAIACFKRAIELDPKLAQGHNNLGVALKDKGQVAEAIAICRKAIELDPKLASAHENLAVVLAAKGQVDEAITCWRKAIELDPKFAKAHENLGAVLANRGQADEAIICLRRAIELDPKRATAHINLGLSLKSKGQIDDAITHYRKAVELDPKHPLAHFRLGVALYDKGQVDEAIVCWREALGLDPINVLGYYNLGVALARKGQVVEAIACYRKTIDLDPKYLNARFKLADSLQAAGQVDEAIDCIKKAIELNPTNAAARINLGRMLQNQARFTESLAAFKQGHELGSKQPGWRNPSAEWVRQAEEFVALESKFPTFLKGEFQPKTNQERLVLASVCRFKKHHHTAAGLYAAAFAADPKLADGPRVQHRYNAACHATLAAAGQGEDAAKLDDAERTRLRKQALDWLRADLSLWAKQLESGPPAGRAAVQRALSHWQKDPDLAAIREAAALAKLPANEQKAFAQLWADVAALLK